MGYTTSVPIDRVEKDSLEKLVVSEIYSVDHSLVLYIRYYVESKKGGYTEKDRQRLLVSVRWFRLVAELASLLSTVWIIGCHGEWQKVSSRHVCSNESLCNAEGCLSEVGGRELLHSYPATQKIENTDSPKLIIYRAGRWVEVRVGANHLPCYLYGAGKCLSSWT